MTLSELAPDVALAALLDGKVEVQTSATTKEVLTVYRHGKTPNKGLPDNYISLTRNGGPKPRTEDGGLPIGYVMVTLSCKANSDNTIKTDRMDNLTVQIEKLVYNKGSDRLFFYRPKENVITPPTVNLTTGYATMILNVAWHTTN